MMSMLKMDMRQQEAAFGQTGLQEIRTGDVTLVREMLNRWIVCGLPLLHAQVSPKCVIFAERDYLDCISTVFTQHPSRRCKA